VISRQVFGFSRHRLAIVANTVVFAAVADKRNPQHLGEIMKRFDMRVSLAVCFAAMIWGAVAHANTIVIGIGTTSCGKFIASIGKNAPGKIEKISTRDGDFFSENAEYNQWLIGFVSGFNFAHDDDLGQQVKSDLAAMDLWMRNWCNKHPTNTVSQGAYAFIDEMRSNAAADQAAPGSGDGYSKPARDSLKKLLEKPAAR
jgi:hypothetical protein